MAIKYYLRDFFHLQKSLAFWMRKELIFKVLPIKLSVI